MKLNNKFIPMLHKDFSIGLFIVFILTFSSWVVVGFLAIGYEEGTDTSNFGKTCYQIAALLNFSGFFWQRLFTSFLSVILSMLTTSGLIIGFISLVKKVIGK